MDQPARAYKILIIDDEECLREIYEKIIKKRFGADRVECVCLQHSKGADYLLLDRVFDLVISGINQPQEDGLTFLTRMRNQGVSVPWIICTGMVDEELKEAVRYRFQCAYINKPIDAASFLKTVTKALGHSDE